MDNIFIIQALLRLLDFAAIKKFNLADKSVDFEDDIGRKAIEINNQLKNTKGLDIFNDGISNSDISKFEHLVGNAMSNHINKKVVLRKVSDEVKVLQKSLQVEPKHFQVFHIDFSKSLMDSLISKIKSVFPNEILEKVKNASFIDFLESDELTGKYIAQSEININSIEYFLVSTLSHENKKKDLLFVTSVFLLRREQYEKYNGNPSQLFLKGLDRYGVDLNINDKLSRFYYDIEVPLDTNVGSTEFLNMQNIDKNEPFSLSMVMKKSTKSIDLKFVFATRTNKILSEFGNNIS